jgi:glutathione S-transferase
VTVVAPPLRVVGSYLSPYVRKVLVALASKGVPYEIDPIVPFFGDERFARASPLRRVPVLIDGQVTLCDSTVICEYLEERHPAPPLLPRGAAARARARWLEEYADTRLGDIFVWKLFHQVAIGPAVWGEPTDRAALEKTLAEDVPPILDFLEGELPAAGFLFGEDRVSLADIAIAAVFRNAAFARFRPDAARWPRTAAFLGRTQALAPFAQLAPFEERCLRTPIAQHRAVLAEMGAPLCAESWAAAAPQRGVMRS